nr:MAG TPA: hypothetical protein [Bacteriophage sp.]
MDSIKPKKQQDTSLNTIYPAVLKHLQQLYHSL